MFRKKHKNKKRFSVNLAVSLSLIVAVLLPVLTPSFASAAIKNVQDQQDRTILYALIRCLKDSDHSDFGDSTVAATFRDENMSRVAIGHISNTDMAVGYEIDSDDGNARCSEMSLTRAMRPIHKTPRWFFEQIYDVNHPDNSSGTNMYPLIDSAADNMAGKLNREMRPYDLAIGKDEKLRRLATAFWVCAEPAPDPPDRDTSTFGGKKYQLLSDAPHEVSVGYDLEGDNGKYECNTLINWGDKAEMAEALSGNPQGSTPGSAGGADPSGSLTDCDTQLLNPLSWIICPVIDIGSGASDYIFQNVAAPLLEDIPIALDPSDGAYSAWQGFRFLANVMIIGTMLVIVYVQAKGGPS